MNNQTLPEWKRILHSLLRKQSLCVFVFFKKLFVLYLCLFWHISCKKKHLRKKCASVSTPHKIRKVIELFSIAFPQYLLMNTLKSELRILTIWSHFEFTTPTGLGNTIWKARGSKLSVFLPHIICYCHRESRSWRCVKSLRGHNPRLTFLVVVASVYSSTGKITDTPQTKTKAGCVHSNNSLSPPPVFKKLQIPLSHLQISYLAKSSS